jgi:hypothetical protein
VTAEDLPKTKEALIREIFSDRRQIVPSHDYYFNGHGPTNFKKWYSTNISYPVSYRLDFEPYVVVYRATDDLPRFYEDFDGYGLNKQSWLEELALAQYKFHVLPSSFLIHINHSYGGDRQIRPYIIKTYASFQAFLRNHYGDSFFAPGALEKNTARLLRKYRIFERRKKKLAEEAKATVVQQATEEKSKALEQATVVKEQQEMNESKKGELKAIVEAAA